jgi:anti-sigma factor ChrR (cupin superfamily)
MKIAAMVCTASIGADKGAMVPTEALVWEPYAGGALQIAKLWGDRDQGAYGMYLKVPAGFKAGSHMHTADYHGVNVQGTWIHTMDGETKELPVGSHVFQPGGQFHDDSCKGPQECIWFIAQDAKGDFIPEKK